MIGTSNSLHDKCDLTHQGTLILSQRAPIEMVTPSRRMNPQESGGLLGRSSSSGKEKWLVPR